MITDANIRVARRRLSTGKRASVPGKARRFIRLNCCRRSDNLVFWISPCAEGWSSTRMWSLKRFVAGGKLAYVSALQPVEVRCREKGCVSYAEFARCGSRTASQPKIKFQMPQMCGYQTVSNRRKLWFRGSGTPSWSRSRMGNRKKWRRYREGLAIECVPGLDALFGRHRRGWLARPELPYLLSTAG